MPLRRLLLKVVVPATLLIIFALLVLTSNRFDEALLIMATLPFALTGGVWVVHLMGDQMLVATGLDFTALAGVAAEFGIVMLLHMKQALQARLAAGAQPSSVLVDDAIREGAALRVRPKAMTVAVILAGLLPIVWGSGTGSEVMNRIAVPMLGGMVTAPLLSLFIVPEAYALSRRRTSPDRRTQRRRGVHTRVICGCNPSHRSPTDARKELSECDTPSFPLPAPPPRPVSA